MESTTYAFISVIMNLARNSCSLSSLQTGTNHYSSEVDSKQRVDDVQDYWRNIFTVVLAYSIIVILGKL